MFPSQEINILTTTCLAFFSIFLLVLYFFILNNNNTNLTNMDKGNAVENIGQDYGENWDYDVWIKQTTAF